MTNTAFTVTRGTFPCSWCDKAIQRLTDAGIPFVVRKLSRADLKELGDKIGQNTVPMIYHGTTFIGGFTELETYLGA